MNIATKNGIGLETAKLFPITGIQAKYCFFKDINGYRIEKTDIVKQILNGISGKYNNNPEVRDIYPAYTWQEILWEHAEEFFGKKLNTEYQHYRRSEYVIRTESILKALQQKDYEKAEQIFMDNCILINKK